MYDPEYLSSLNVCDVFPTLFLTWPEVQTTQVCSQFSATLFARVCYKFLAPE